MTKQAQAIRTLLASCDADAVPYSHLNADGTATVIRTVSGDVQEFTVGQRGKITEVA